MFTRILWFSARDARDSLSDAVSRSAATYRLRVDMCNRARACDAGSVKLMDTTKFGCAAARKESWLWRRQVDGAEGCKVVARSCRSPCADAHGGSQGGVVHSFLVRAAAQEPSSSSTSSDSARSTCGNNRFRQRNELQLPLGGGCAAVGGAPGPAAASARPCRSATNAQASRAGNSAEGRIPIPKPPSPQVKPAVWKQR